ncbi:Radial spoke head protein 9, partial [Gonapodya sp. JEL0774]
MELHDIPALASGSGFTLNVEERAVLASSLAVLRDAERLHQVRLWGKVLAMSRAYYVATGWGDDYFRRKYFYSMDAVTWLLLPDVTAEEQKAAGRIPGRFTGDIAFEYSTV